MSDFQDRPKFYLPEQKNLGQSFEKFPDSDLAGQSNGILKSLVLKGLLRQVRDPFNEGEYQRKNKQRLRSQRKKGKGFRQ